MKIRGFNDSVFPRQLHVAFIVSTVVLASFFAHRSPLRAQTRPNRPASSYAQSTGVPLSTIIVFGDQYNGGDELYDAKITVAEVVRGEKAWQMVKSAGDANMRPSPGMQYLLARVKFEFAARVRPEHYSYTLDPSQFSAMSAATAPYAAAALAAPVEPELRATLHTGDSAEGWVAFLIPRGDHTPLMMFREDVGSVIHQGDSSFFKLYNGKSVGTAKANAP
jgi:hypothetical protein